MARMTCLCGEEMSDSNHPEIQYQVFSDTEWLGLMSSKINDPVNDIRWPRITYWKCRSCARLYVFEDERTKAVYTLDPQFLALRPEQK
jgi:hypothetical protein